jgi:hypothetical protein
MTIPRKDSSILEWVDKNQLKNGRNDVFEFDTHSFLLDPLCDWSPEIVIRKSAQIGFSETFGVLKSLFAAKHMMLDVIYTLPTNSLAEDFVRQKVNPIISYNPVIKDSVSQDLLDMKQVGNRFVRFRGAHNSELADKRADTSTGISLTSDLNVYDERDRSDQFIIDQYSSRLENSLYGGQWSFSNPSYPGVGCDAIWENSDQKHWMIKCLSCNHHQFLDWVKLGEVVGVTDHCKIDVENKQFVCGKCEKPISDTTRMLGEWVAKYPEREISGYWMSQLNYVRHNVKGLLKKEADKKPQTFYNYTLGKPYRDSTSNIDRGLIVNNIVRTVNPKERVYMGVDQGVVKHYVIGDDEGIFEVGTTKDWNEIDRLIRKYNATTVIDNLPDRAEPVKLANKYNGKNGRPKVYRCTYKESRDPGKVVVWGKNKETDRVFIERTAAFDVIVDFFVQRLFPLNLTVTELALYIDHWQTMNRIEVLDTKGIIRAKWESSNGQDHFAHATLYFWAAASRTRGQGQVNNTNVPDPIPTNKAAPVSDNWTSALPSMDELLRKELDKQR